MTKALICGISGQDGAYLAQLLLDKGYQVTGTSRDAQITPFANLQHLGIRGWMTCSLLYPFLTVCRAMRAMHNPSPGLPTCA